MFVKNEYATFRVGSVAQKDWTLFFWIDGDTSPLVVYADLLQALSNRFSWILKRQIRIIDDSIDIFWRRNLSMRVRLLSKSEFDQRVAGFSRDLDTIDFLKANGKKIFVITFNFQE